MNIYFWLGIGIIGAFLVHTWYPRAAKVGIIGDIFLGTLGALEGGFLAYFLMGIPLSRVHHLSFLFALCGSLLILFLQRMTYSQTRGDSVEKI